MPRRIHRCAARGCTRIIPSVRLMCGPHWAMVPVAIRDLIDRTYRKVGAGPDYYKAVAAARDAVDNC